MGAVELPSPADSVREMLAAAATKPVDDRHTVVETALYIALLENMDRADPALVEAARQWMTLPDGDTCAVDSEDGRCLLRLRAVAFAYAFDIRDLWSQQDWPALAQAPDDWYELCLTSAVKAFEAATDPACNPAAVKALVDSVRAAQSEREQPYLDAEPAFQRGRAIALVSAYHLLASAQALADGDGEACQRHLSHADVCAERVDVGLSVALTTVAGAVEAVTGAARVRPQSR